MQVSETPAAAAGRVERVAAEETLTNSRSLTHAVNGRRSLHAMYELYAAWLLFVIQLLSCQWHCGWQAHAGVAPPCGQVVTPQMYIDYELLLILKSYKNAGGVKPLKTQL